MTVSELIEELRTLNPNSTIYLHDSYYDTIEGFLIKQIDTEYHSLPENATPLSYWIEWKGEKP